MVHWAWVPFALFIGMFGGLFLAAMIDAGGEKEGRNHENSERRRSAGWPVD